MKDTERRLGISFPAPQPREGLHARDPVRHGDHVGEALIEMGLGFRAVGEIAENKVRSSGDLSMFHLSSEVQERTRLLLYLIAEVRPRCFFQLLDQDAQRSIAGVRRSAELAAGRGEIGEPAVPGPCLGESPELEAKVGELLQRVPLKSVGAFRRKGVLGGAEKSIGALHVAALEAELFCPKNGNPDGLARIPSLPAQGFDPVDLERGLIKAIQPGQDAMQSGMRSNGSRHITNLCEGCRCLAIHLFRASGFFPSKISKIEQKPGMVRMLSDQLFEPACGLASQAAIAADIREALGGLFRIRCSGEAILADRES